MHAQVRQTAMYSGGL